MNHAEHWPGHTGRRAARRFAPQLSRHHGRDGAEQPVVMARTVPWWAAVTRPVAGCSADLAPPARTWSCRFA